MPTATPSPVSARPGSGKTLRVSIWIIAGLALAQIAAIGFAVVRNDLGNRSLADRRPAELRPTFANSTTVPAGFPPIDRMFRTDTMTPAPPAPELVRTTDQSIQDPVVREMLTTARLWRKKGDVQTALEQFRRANQHLPDNPEILYELASCYGTLDLQDEASDAWLAIRQLGPERGGEFYKIADLALLGSKDGGAARRSVITLGNNRLYQHPQETSGEMVTLRAAIKAVPGVEIDPSSVHLRVLFFDLIDDRTVARGLHEGEYPQHLVTEPIDWKDTLEEIIDFVYFRPHANDPTENRRFYGFVAQLFYDDEWQDLIAQPRTLLEEMRAVDEIAPSHGSRDSGGSRIEPSLFPQP